LIVEDQRLRQRGACLNSLAVRSPLTAALFDDELLTIGGFAVRD